MAQAATTKNLSEYGDRNYPRTATCSHRYRPGLRWMSPQFYKDQIQSWRKGIFPCAESWPFRQSRGVSSGFAKSKSSHWELCHAQWQGALLFERSSFCSLCRPHFYWDWWFVRGRDDSCTMSRQAMAKSPNTLEADLVSSLPRHPWARPSSAPQRTLTGRRE